MRVVKILGGGLKDSQLVHGMIFNREPETNVKRATNAKVAVFTCPLDISRTETKGTVLIKDAKEMLSFNKGEENQMEQVCRTLQPYLIVLQTIKSISESGVKVLVTGSSISDLALHFINRYGLLACKVLSKFELRRLCRVMGATPLARLGAPLPEEIGHVDVVEVVEIGSDRCTVFKQGIRRLCLLWSDYFLLEKQESKTVSLVIRGSTQNQLDDVERAITSGVSVYKALLKDGRLVAGAGAVEIGLAKKLHALGEVTYSIFCQFIICLENGRNVPVRY